MSLTSANAVVTLAIASLYTIPQQLQGFTADDIFDAENIETAEVVMGLDGTLSAGYVPAPVKWSVTLKADSPSIALFEAWHAAQQAAQDVYTATGVIILPATSQMYTMTNGILTNYSPMPSAKKLLQPRKFIITWETILGASA